MLLIAGVDCAVPMAMLIPIGILYCGVLGLGGHELLTDVDHLVFLSLLVCTGLPYPSVGSICLEYEENAEIWCI